MNNHDELQSLEHWPMDAETQADKFNACYNFMNIMGWDVKEIVFNDDSKSRYGYDFLD